MGESNTGHPLLIEESRSRSIRVGDWKFIHGVGPKCGNDANLAEDKLFHPGDHPGEERDVIKRNPEKAEEICRLLKKVENGPGIRETTE